jgi:uncharacterized protein YqeY
LYWAGNNPENDEIIGDEVMCNKEQFQNDLKDAMRSGDDVRKRTLRMTLSAIKLAEVDQGELDDNAIMAIIQKEIKSRLETIEDAVRANNQDLIQESQAEIDVLKAYLPEQLSSEELDELARQAVEAVGAESVREMGQVMKVLMPRLQGRATGQQASQAVRKLLA